MNISLIVFKDDLAGQYKQKVITLCRNALKVNNFFAMIQVKNCLKYHLLFYYFFFMLIK